MRVAYDHQVFSLQDKGGISRYFFELIYHLGGLNSVQLEVLRGANHNLFQLPSLPQIHTWEYRGSLVMMPGKSRYILNHTISSILMPMLGKFDVYHPTLYKWVRAVRHTKMVVTHHDCAYERFPELFPNAESIRKMRARQFERADAIICPSHSSRRDLQEFYGVPEERTAVIHHGISQLATPGYSGVRLAKRPFLLYVGSRAAYKNFPALLKAFAAGGLHQSFDIVVLGGAPVTRTELALLSDLSITDRVHFIPQATDDDLLRGYHQAHLLVYPSLYEGFGFPPLEAMFHGCPVLVANTSSLPEVCGEGAFYFDPKESEDLSLQLKRVCFDDSARQRKIELGTSRASAYSWRRCALETQELYQA